MHFHNNYSQKKKKKPRHEKTGFGQVEISTHKKNAQFWELKK